MEVTFCGARFPTKRKRNSRRHSRPGLRRPVQHQLRQAHQPWQAKEFCGSWLAEDAWLVVRFSTEVTVLLTTGGVEVCNGRSLEDSVKTALRGMVIRR